MKNQVNTYALSFIKKDAKEALFNSWKTQRFYTGTNMRPSIGDDILYAASYKGKTWAMIGSIGTEMTQTEKDICNIGTGRHFHATFATAPVRVTSEFLVIQGGNILREDRADLWNEITGESRVTGSKSAKKTKLAREIKTPAESMYDVAMAVINSSEDEEGCAIETSVGIRYIDRSEQLGFTLAEMREFILGAA